MVELSHKIHDIGELLMNKATLFTVLYFSLQPLFNMLHNISTIFAELIPVVNVFVGITAGVYSLVKIYDFIKNKKTKE